MTLFRPNVHVPRYVQVNPDPGLVPPDRDHPDPDDPAPPHPNDLVSAAGHPARRQTNHGLRQAEAGNTGRQQIQESQMIGNRLQDPARTGGQVR